MTPCLSHRSTQCKSFGYRHRNPCALRGDGSPYDRRYCLAWPRAGASARLEQRARVIGGLVRRTRGRLQRSDALALADTPPPRGCAPAPSVGIRGCKSIGPRLRQCKPGCRGSAPASAGCLRVTRRRNAAVFQLERPVEVVDHARRGLRPRRSTGSRPCRANPFPTDGAWRRNRENRGQVLNCEFPTAVNLPRSSLFGSKQEAPNSRFKT